MPTHNNQNIEVGLPTPTHNNQNIEVGLPTPNKNHSIQTVCENSLNENSNIPVDISTQLDVTTAHVLLKVDGISQGRVVIKDSSVDGSSLLQDTPEKVINYEAPTPTAELEFGQINSGIDAEFQLQLLKGDQPELLIAESMEVDGVECVNIAENYQERSKALEAIYAAINSVVEDNSDILRCGKYCIKLEHGLVILDDDDFEGDSVTIKPYKCSICSKLYKSEAGFVHHIKGGHNTPEENDLVFHAEGDSYNLVPFQSLLNKNDIRCIYVVPLRDENNAIVQVAVGQTAGSDIIWSATSNVTKALLEIQNEIKDGKSTSPSTSCGSLKNILLTTNWYIDVNAATQVPKLYASSFKSATHLKLACRYWLNAVKVLGTLQHLLKFKDHVVFIDKQLSLITDSTSEKNIEAMKQNRKVDYKLIIQNVVLADRLKYVCNVCQESFPKPNAFKQHMLKQHQIDLFNHRMEISKTITIKSCESGNSFFCVICDKHISSKGNLKLHLNTIHTVERKFSCNQCEKHFKTKSVLKTHVNMVHLKLRKFSCDQCDKHFKTKSHLQVHVNRLHITESAVHSPVRDFACSKCDKRFKTKGVLKTHVNMVHLKLRKFSCDQCDKHFKTKSHLQVHVNRLHITESAVHSPVRDFACSKCDKRFKTKGVLKTHVSAVHLKLRKFSCDQCDKRFKAKRTLKAHMVTHVPN